MTTNRVSRRTFTATAAGIAVGVFATSRTSILAQEGTAVAGQATPVVTAQGYVSTRLRTAVSAEARAEVNEAVMSQFAEQVKSLDGYEGYLLGDVIDEPTLTLAIVVLDDADKAPAFTTAVSEFVESIADKIIAEKTQQWEGDVLIKGIPASSSAGQPATPMAAQLATPVVAAPVNDAGGYAAVRVHTSPAGTDPRDIVPAIISGFLPIVTGLPGFQGYLWYPIDTGFVAISLFDSVEAATASNAAARSWAVEFVSAYTDGNPQIINADVVYADLPVLASA